MSEKVKYKEHNIYIVFKTCIDTVLALLGLILLSPLFLGIVIAIKIEDGIKAPVLFSQKRVGRDEKLFMLYKFRSMRLDTPHDTPTHLLSDPDKYITKVGRFLRKTSLDELPQIFNILKEDMAIVGPRPALWNQYDLIAERNKYGANSIKPGLTGWAQIHGRDELEIPDKAKLDGYYVENMSFALDIRCFFGTFLAVAKADGVVEGGTGAMHEKKRRVVIITNHSYMLWRFRRELMEELLKSHDITVLTPFVGHEDDIASLGIKTINTPIERRGMNPIHDIKLIKTYKKLLRAEQPEFVITYSIKPNIYAGIACRKLKIRYFANVQGLGTAFQKKMLASFVTKLYKYAFKGVSKVFFENEVNAREFRDRRILTEDKQVVLHGAGVNLKTYEKTAYPENERVHFLYLGRIMREKGIDELFSAVRRLNNEGFDFVLDLVGFFEDEYESEVTALTEQGIAVFHGFQTDPIPYYAACDCVVLPSYHEGMSNVLLEAAAMARPLITSDIPGCREAVDDGRTGFLVPVRDAESLYEKLKAFINMPRAAREAMGAAGHEKIKNEFDKEDIVSKTVSVLLA